MKSINDLLKKHPDLYKKLNSEQRNLSKQLLKIRLKKQKNVTEFSKMLGISEKKYLEFEFGDMHIPVAEYNKLLKQVENLSYKDSMNFTIKVAGGPIKYDSMENKPYIRNKSYSVFKSRKRKEVSSNMVYTSVNYQDTSRYIVEKEVYVHG